MRKAALVLAVTAIIAIGCPSSSPDPEAADTPAAGPSTRPTDRHVEPDCPNQEAAVAGSRTQGSRAGDIDGDGSDDMVYLAVDQNGPQGCRAFVVADTEGGRLAEEISDPDISVDLGLPTVESITPVDGRPGAEIVVRILAGASTLFVGLFTVHEGELERVQVAGQPQYGNLFPSGGSVGHLEGSDCSGDGIMISLAVPEGRHYEVTRTFFSLSATMAEPTHTEVAFVRPRNLNRYPELGAPPFSDCPPEE